MSSEQSNLRDLRYIFCYFEKITWLWNMLRIPGLYGLQTEAFTSLEKYTSHWGLLEVESTINVKDCSVEEYEGQLYHGEVKRIVGDEYEVIVMLKSG